MKDLKHLIYFESLLENADNELVKKAQADGQLALGYTCYHVPEVLLNVDNCFSVRLRAPNTGSIDIATYYMSNYTCEYARALVERGIEGGYQFLDAMIGVDACSMMNRAMEHFEIEQTRVAHDALGDAYNTALVASRLDMTEGLRLYPDAARILATRMPNYKPPADPTGPDALSHDCFDGFESKAAAFADSRLTQLACPCCGAETKGQKWVNQGDQRYMNIYTCQEHGAYLVRAKFRKCKEDNTWLANKLVYEADEAMQDFYKTKATQARRRGRGHTRRKNRPANKQ